MKGQLSFFEEAPAPQKAKPETPLYEFLMAGMDRLHRSLDQQTKELEDMLRRLGVDPNEAAPARTVKQSNRMPTITEDVKTVLSNCVITESSATLPAGQLDKKLYDKIKKVLETAGGKWNTSAQAFLFKRDPREQLGLSLSTGKVSSTKKDTQAFYTPAAVAERVLAHAPVLSGMKVLEPSAGEGALADALRATGADVICAEFDPESAAVLSNKGYQTHVGDFLNMVPEYGLFDAVVMNPPFTKGQDMKHVRHAFNFLKPGGTLLAIMSPSFTFASSAPAKQFAAFVAEHGSVVEEFEPGAFKESGTNVRTVLVKLAA